MEDMTMYKKLPIVQQPKLSEEIVKPSYQKRIEAAFKDENRRASFTASIVSAVAANPELSKCTPHTLFSNAMLGESLNLSPSPQLGQYYFVPFPKKVKDENGIATAEYYDAQFIMGYKGYIQLATRSGLFKKFLASEIKEGEIVRIDPIFEEYEFKAIDDFDLRETLPTVGYFASFELMNGFTKRLYWSASKLIGHCDKFSPGFNKDVHYKLQNGEIAKKDEWKYSGVWYKNFESMALKTMIRQIIKWCPLSLEINMQKAYEMDGQILELKEDNSIVGEYPMEEIIIDEDKVSLNEL
jgi:recombination protein RecT